MSCLPSRGVDTLLPSHSNSVNNGIKHGVRSTSVTSSGAAVGTHLPGGELVTPPPSFSKTNSIAEAVSCPPRVVADTVPPTHSAGEVVSCPPSGGAHTWPPTDSEVEAVSCLPSGGVDTLLPSHSNSVNNATHLVVRSTLVTNHVVRSTLVTSPGAAAGTQPPRGELITQQPSFSETSSNVEAVSCPPLGRQTRLRPLTLTSRWCSAPPLGWLTRCFQKEWETVSPP